MPRKKQKQNFPQEYLERIKKFRLLDDTFFTSCFDGSRACMELLLRIVLNNPELAVETVTTQKNVPNLYGRGVRFDVFARGKDGRLYDCEIQRSDLGAVPRRARYNSSMLDARETSKGTGFENLPETFVIFITEHDIFHRKFPCYHVERVIRNTNELFDDGAHIIYVNGEYNGSDAIGKLIHDFHCADPDDMFYPVLAERSRFFKQDAKGVATMCKIMEDFGNEVQHKKAVTIALNLIRMNQMSKEDIAKATGLTIEEVNTLAEKRSA